MKKQLLTIGFIIVTLIATTLSTYAENRVKGNGNVIKKEFNVNSFTGIGIGSIFKIYLKQGSTQSVILETDDNILEVLAVDVSRNTLEVSMEKGTSIEGPTTMNLYITVEDLNRIELNGAAMLELQSDINAGQNMAIELTGASKIKNTATIKANDIDIETSGAGKIEMNIVCNTLNIDASGGSKVILSGSADNKKTVDASGGSSVSIEKVKSKESKLEVSGGSRITTNKGEILISSTSGGGTIKTID